MDWYGTPGEEEAEAEEKVDRAEQQHRRRRLAGGKEQERGHTERELFRHRGQHQRAVADGIAGDPVRYRALMLPSVAEKLAFGVPALLLFASGKAPAPVLLFGAIDLLLGLGFFLAWRAIPIHRA